jgi:hypothetical protein
MTILSFVDWTYLEGFVDSSETTSPGRLARNAPRQLMVRGTCHVSDVNLRRGEEKDERHSIQCTSAQLLASAQLSLLIASCPSTTMFQDCTTPSTTRASSLSLLPPSTFVSRGFSNPSQMDLQIMSAMPECPHS